MDQRYLPLRRISDSFKKQLPKNTQPFYFLLFIITLSTFSLIQPWFIVFILTIYKIKTPEILTNTNEQPSSQIISQALVNYDPIVAAYVRIHNLSLNYTFIQSLNDYQLSQSPRKSQIQGLSLFEINKLRKINIKQITLEQVCPICLEELNQDEFLRELQCNHIFHANCIDRWLIKKRKCPYCNCIQYFDK